MIGERLASVRQGRGAVLFVQGRAGFGKTRLLAEAAAMASRTGIRAGFGAVQASDQVVPMGGLVAALFDGREPLVDPGVLSTLHFLPSSATGCWRNSSPCSKKRRWHPRSLSASTICTGATAAA